MVSLSKASQLVFISGVSSGIGEAVAVALASRGDRVVGSVKEIGMAQHLHRHGIELIELDLREPDSVDAALERLLKVGLPDVVIHNAGFGCYGMVEDLPRMAIEEQFAANVFGAQQINHALIPAMRTRGSGRIVLVSSVLGVVAMRGRGLYVASKYALEGLADTMRLELFGSGVEVVVVEPGPIETHFRASALAALRRFVAPGRAADERFYERFVAGLGAERSSNRFALSAEACVPAVIKAVDTPRPRARYCVTIPAKVFPILRRILPTRALDWVLRRG